MLVGADDGGGVDFAAGAELPFLFAVVAVEAADAFVAAGGDDGVLVDGGGGEVGEVAVVEFPEFGAIVEVEGGDAVAVVGDVGGALIDGDVVADVGADVDGFDFFAGGDVDDIEDAVAAAEDGFAFVDGGGTVDVVGGFVFPEFGAGGGVEAVEEIIVTADEEVFFAFGVFPDGGTGVDFAAGFEFPFFFAVVDVPCVDEAVAAASDDEVVGEGGVAFEGGFFFYFPDFLACGEVDAEEFAALAADEDFAIFGDRGGDDAFAAGFIACGEGPGEGEWEVEFGVGEAVHGGVAAWVKPVLGGWRGGGWWGLCGEGVVAKADEERERQIKSSREGNGRLVWHVEFKRYEWGGEIDHPLVVESNESERVESR